MTPWQALPEAELRAALPAADLRVLLMVVYHLTGDRRWLEPRYRPKRDVLLISDEDCGFPVEVQQEIREAAADLLTRPQLTPPIRDPGDAHMVELMSACLGEPVAPEYAPMMREEMGFARRQVGWGGPPPATPETPVIIVGAGASGLALAANLETLGIPYLVLEENDEVGGTWLVNSYPGCAVDTPNHAYSFSFGTRFPWTRYFSLRDDLLAYMIERSHEFGVRDKIRFRTRVTRADWDEAEKLWRVAVESSAGTEVLTCWALISAIGPLSKPKTPAIAGSEDFRGRMFHSNRWPQDIDIKGKSVAVVGTGASSMQIVPSIAGQVGQLAVYQRTPQWVRHIPRFQDQMSPGACWLLEHVPFYARWFRFTMLWRYGDGLLRTLRRDPDWPHPERSMNRMNDRHRIQMTEYIKAELAGRPDLIAKCLPSYPPYAKRILLDNGWYKTLRRDNVELIVDGIERITPTGIRAQDGIERPVEIIVLATGFDVFRNAARLNVTGRGGRRLDDEWADDDPKAYLGIAAPGFPNLFMLQGPNTVLAHGGSAIFTTECQARFIVASLVGMLEHGIAAIDVRRDAHDAYMARVDAEHRELVWNHPGMTPWYRNKKGRVAAAIPWRLVDYRAMTYTPNFDDFEVTRADNAV